MITLVNESRIISDFLHSIGPWKGHVVIGGGYALIIYKLFLANQVNSNPPIGTRDLDSLIPRKIPTVSKKDISQYLKEAGFKHIFKDYENPATESYCKEINGIEIEIEFLTASSTRSDKNKNVVISGVIAQPLSYLQLSLQRTVEFKTDSNETGLVVSPAAWIFHKGLTFTKRKSASKLFKDLYGIWYVTSQLGEISNDSIIEFSFLSKHHPKWFKTFRDNLKNWIERASPKDWSQLESQDPFGKLKKLQFERYMQLLIQ